jgi:hypothetical protein
MKNSGWLAALVLGAGVAQGFERPIHVSITEDAMTSVSVVDPQTAARMEFTSNARAGIADENDGEDDNQFDPAVHVDNAYIALASQRVASKRSDILWKLLSSNDGKGARELLGEALHTIQDFYSHSTWVNAGHVGIAPLGGALAAQPSACINGVPRTGMLTSGYFSLLGYVEPIAAETLLGQPSLGNCLHGQSVVPGISINGIHKDAKGRPLHPAARDLATSASRAFAQDIVNTLAAQNRYDAIYAFFGEAMSIATGLYRTPTFEVLGSRYTLFGCEFERKRRGTLVAAIGSPSAPFTLNQNYARWDYVELAKPVVSRPDIYGCAPTDWGNYGNSSTLYALTHQAVQIDGAGVLASGQVTPCPIPGCFDKLTIHPLTPSSVRIELERYEPGGTVGSSTWIEGRYQGEVVATR